MINIINSYWNKNLKFIFKKVYFNYAYYGKYIKEKLKLIKTYKTLYRYSDS
jgi:hypothetical protein